MSSDTNTKDNVPVEKHVTIPPANQWTSSPAYDQPLFTSSSEGQASLQEIWKMLDAEESFQSPTPRKARPSSPQWQVVARDLEPDHTPARKSPERDVFALTGRRAEAQSRPAKQRPELSKEAAGKAKLTPKKLKVRNYNIKDDPSWWPVVGLLYVCTRAGRSATKKITVTLKRALRNGKYRRQ